MSHLQAESKILIAGAGVCGLALAQILRRHSISFEIFERSHEVRREQGWSLGLDTCLSKLRSLLPEDLDNLEAASPNYGTGKPDSLAFINPRTHELQGVVGQELGAILIDRKLLRKLLMKHVNVRYNKHLIRYESNQDGVTAHFKDGTSAHGSVLIGADGANSLVRQQLLDGFKATPSQAIPLNGEVVLQKSQIEPILQYSSCGVLYGEPGLKGTLFVGEWFRDDTALFNWTCAWLSKNLQEEIAWSQTASQWELHEKAKEITAHLPSYIKEAIEQTGPSGMQQPAIRLVETVIPEDRLPPGRVTLIGDAAHSMVPFRGMGANTAMLDACELAEAITAGIKDGSNIDQIFRAYELNMIPRGRKKVLESREVAESEDSFDVSGGRLDDHK